jgi:hypothetical protein
VDFGNPTVAADATAVQQCVTFAESHVNDIENEIAGTRGARGADRGRMQPESPDETQTRRGENERPLEQGEVLIPEPPIPPRDVAENEQELPPPPVDPCGEIAGLLVQIDSLVKAAYRKDLTLRDYENIPNHFVCRIPNRWPQGGTDIIISGMKPKFDDPEARRIHNIEDSRRETERMDFVHHRHFRHFHKLLNDCKIVHRCPNENGPENARRVVFVDAMPFVSNKMEGATRTFRALGSQQEIIYRLLATYFDCYWPRVMLSHAHFPHHEFIPQFLERFEAERIITNLSVKSNATRSYKRYDLLWRNKELSILSTSLFIPRGMRHCKKHIERDIKDLLG